MGGRGSSSGISNKGIKYGTEFKSLLTYGNIKFLVPSDPNDSVRVPMETMTRNRVYVVLDKNGEPKNIAYYDKNNMRKKQIDLQHQHDKVMPHTHHGYEHKENDTAKGYAHLTDKEQKMVQQVKEVWKEKKNHAWTKWKNSH